MLVLRPPAGYADRRVDEVVFTSDGRALAAAGRGLLVWPAFASGGPAVADPLPVVEWGTRLAATSDGTLFVGSYRHLHSYNPATGRVTHVPTGTQHGTRFGVSADGTRLVVSEVRADWAAQVTCWTVDDYAIPVWRLGVAANIHLPPLLMPTGDRFAQIEVTPRPSGHGYRAQLVTRSVADGTAIASSEPLPEYPEQVCLSPDGATLAARVRKRVYTGPVGGRVVAASVANDTRKHFTGIAFHPSGRYLAATSNDATVKLYDTATWELARTFTWDVGRMRSVAFSPDGTLAAAGSDTGKVVVWDVDL